MIILVLACRTLIRMVAHPFTSHDASGHDLQRLGKEYFRHVECVIRLPRFQLLRHRTHGTRAVPCLPGSDVIVGTCWRSPSESNVPLLIEVVGPAVAVMFWHGARMGLDRYGQ